MPERDEPKLYTSYILREDGTKEVVGYAYGPSWIEQALYMDDLKFNTPEEAKAWWERWEKKHAGKS